MPASAKAERAQKVEFSVFKKMPYGTRVPLIFGCLVVGILIQLFIKWWWGLPFVFFGILLSLYASTTNKPRGRRFGRWENVTLEEFAKIQQMFKKTAEWARRDPLAIPSPLGCLIFLLLLVIVGLIGAVLLMTMQDKNSSYVIVADGLLMLLFFFGAG